MRDVRLRALADAPHAFVLTLESALERPDEWWRDWAARSAIEDTQALFVGWEGNRAVALAGIFDDDGEWVIFAMWVVPEHRGSGVGRALLDEAVGFARPRNQNGVFLSVTDGNDPARRLYERYGFVDTGERDSFGANELRLS